MMPWSVELRGSVLECASFLALSETLETDSSNADQKRVPRKATDDYDSSRRSAHCPSLKIERIRNPNLDKP
jgi:hypothetical protein